MLTMNETNPLDRAMPDEVLARLADATRAVEALLPIVEHVTRQADEARAAAMALEHGLTDEEFGAALAGSRVGALYRPLDAAYRAVMRAQGVPA